MSPATDGARSGWLHGAAAEIAGREQFLAIVARATPPFDRQRTTPAAPPGQRAAEQARRWLETVTGGAPDSERAGRVLAEFQISRGDLVACFAAAAPGSAPLPDWAQSLAVFLAAQPAGHTGRPRPAGRPEASDRESMHRIHDCFGRAAAPLLSSAGGVPIPLRLADSAAADLRAQLASRLSFVAAPALDFELQQLSAAEMGTTASAWLDRFDTLPGLAYVLGVACANWRQSAAEMLGRLAADLPILAERLWPGHRADELVGVRGDAGDLHNQGRAVAVLRLNGGHRVVYKPKNLAGAAQVQRLLAVLDQPFPDAAPLGLPPRVVLPRGEYGWEEYVAAAPCDDPGGPARFYRRMGMLARLWQFLEARDFWLDNLIPAGEVPVFIDLETILQPRPAPHPDGMARERALYRDFEETVAPTGSVVAASPVAPGCRAEQIGALAPHRTLVIPYRPGLERLQAITGVLDLHGEHARWDAPQAAPQYADQVAEPTDYADDVVAGYTDMHRRLLDAKESLRSADGPLRPLASLPVRYIWHSTWAYLTILRGSLSPAALADACSREIMLARLFKAIWAQSWDPSSELGLVHAEVDALRGLDIPFFRTQPDSATVRTLGAREVRGHLDQQTPWDRLQQRLAELENFPLARHLAALEACLEVIDHAAGRSRPVGWLPPLRPAGGAAKFLDAAVAIGELILDASHAGDEAPGWLGLHYDPFHDMLSFCPLRDDLLSGTGGIAVFLAELAAATGHVRAAKAARSVAASTAAATSICYWSSGRDPGRPTVGAFVGLGSALYTASRTSAALAAGWSRGPVLGSLQASTLRTILGPGALDRAGPDAVSGRAGLLLAITGLPAQDRAGVAGLAERLAQGLAVPRPRGPEPYPPEAHRLDGLPLGAAGVALALARAAALGLYPRTQASLPVPGRDATIGSILAALGVAHARVQAPPAAVLQQATATVRGTLAAAGRATEGALAELVDVAVLAHRCTGQDQWRELSRAAAAELLHRRNWTGRWLPSRRGPDQMALSIVDGLPAVGMAFLQAADPAIPSVRLVSSRPDGCGHRVTVPPRSTERS